MVLHLNTSYHRTRPPDSNEAFFGKEMIYLLTRTSLVEVRMLSLLLLSCITIRVVFAFVAYYYFPPGICWHLGLAFIAV